MFVHMEKMDKMHTENMSKLTTTMESFSNSNAYGFSMLRQLLQPSLQQPSSAHPWQASSNVCQQNTPPQRQQTYSQSHTFAQAQAYNQAQQSYNQFQLNYSQTKPQFNQGQPTYSRVQQGFKQTPHNNQASNSLSRPQSATNIVCESSQEDGDLYSHGF